MLSSCFRIIKYNVLWHYSIYVCSLNMTFSMGFFCLWVAWAFALIFYLFHAVERKLQFFPTGGQPTWYQVYSPRWRSRTSWNGPQGEMLLFFTVLCGLWLRGLGDVHWPQNFWPPQNSTMWTTWNWVPYVPKYSQATPQQKYIQVKLPINCVARWPRGLGNVHWP